MFLAIATDSAPNLAPIAVWVGASDPENFIRSFWILYIIINVLSIVVYNLGFAKKLPMLKSVVVYGVMFFGNMFITFLAFSLPIIESLFIAGVVLGIYKFQLRRHKNELEANENGTSS